MSNNFKAEKLEIKLFRIGGWVSASGTLFLLIIDTFVFNHHEAAILESVALVAFIIFTYISYHRPSERNMHLFLLMILLVVNLAFFVEEGWATPSAVIFFISILYGTVLVQSKYAKTIVIIFLSNFFALTIIEYFIFPVPKYASETLENTQLLHNIYALLGVVITVLLVNYFKSMYDKERYAINATNFQLDFANNELSSKNNSLLEAQTRIRDKQALLEENREKLIDANNQLGQLNKYLDETVRKRKLELSHINKELGLLFYRSSHDFRRPLTTLKGLALVSNLTNQQKLPKRILDLVDQTADTMSRMLDKFLMLYQINDLPRYPNTGWEDIRSSISKLVMTIDNLDFNCDINTDKYQSNDRRNFLLDIIIKNLVENCCFYRDEEVNTNVEVKLNETDGKIHLSVWDDGLGIPFEIRDRIFEIYFRGSKYSKGNGLGLYVVQSAVKKLNGSMQVTSEESEYTQFDISFKV